MKFFKMLFLAGFLFLIGSSKPVSFAVVKHFTVNVLSYALVSHFVTEGIAGCVDNFKESKVGETASGGFKARLLSKGTVQTNSVKALMAILICLAHRGCPSAAIMLKRWNLAVSPNFIVGLTNYLLTPAPFRVAILEDV